VFAAPLFLSAAAAAGAIPGNWIVADRTAIVAIAPCGTSLCGRVAKVLVSRPGQPKTDVNNPDKGLLNRPIQGLPILWGFRLKDGAWTSGRIYDPKSGKTYRSELKLNRDGSLSVSGCIAFICQSQRWTRAR